MRPNVDDRIHSMKQLVGAADELLDSEVEALGKIVGEAVRKWQHQPNTVENLNELRAEVLHDLMDINIVAELDPTPCFHGEAPILEIIGKAQGDPIHQYGFDHEQKRWEVQKAIERGEDWFGQKEAAKSRKK